MKNEKPKRILVIGCCGAGKSTFSRKLAEKTGLPLIHLDQEYWRAGWVEPPKAEWEAKVAELAARANWIMDGNYSGSFPLRMPRADTVIYLDYPTAKCVWRVVNRIMKYHGSRRPDMPPGCNERFDWNFLHYVAVFNLTRRKKILNWLSSLRNNQQGYTFKTDKAADQYLADL